MIRDLYTLAIVLINLQEEIGEKQFVYFILIGGPKKPLNAHSPSIVNANLFQIGPPSQVPFSEAAPLVKNQHTKFICVTC